MKFRKKVIVKNSPIRCTYCDNDKYMKHRSNQFQTLRKSAWIP